MVTHASISSAPLLPFTSAFIYVKNLKRPYPLLPGVLHLQASFIALTPLQYCFHHTSVLAPSALPEFRVSLLTTHSDLCAAVAKPLLQADHWRNSSASSAFLPHHRATTRLSLQHAPITFPVLVLFLVDPPLIPAFFFLSLLHQLQPPTCISSHSILLIT